MTKSNGVKSITQVFGFYAQKHPGYFFPVRPLPSTIKNNQLREINASIEMSLTEAQFNSLREKAFELAKREYAAADFNCTNYGLDLFNSIRTKPISIETYTVYLPHNNNMYGTGFPTKMIIDKTPQMLFKKLKEMKSGTIFNNHYNKFATHKMAFGNNDLLYSNTNGTFTFDEVNYTGRNYKLCMVNFEVFKSINKKDTILYRIHPKNIFKFWRWATI